MSSQFMNNVNACFVSSKVCTAERMSPHEKHFSSDLTSLLQILAM